MAKLRNRRGVTLVLMAFMLTVLIGSAAFTIDFGRMFMYRSQLQVAADASALAGAHRILKKDPCTATDSAIAYAGRHKVGADTARLAAGDVILGSWTSAGGFVPSTASPACGDPGLDAVKTTPRDTATYGLGRIFGLSTRPLSASAIAVMGYVGFTTCVRPVAIPYQSLLNQLYPTGHDPVTGDTITVDYNLTPADVDSLRAAGVSKAVSLKLGSDATQGNFYIVNLGPYSHSDQVPLSPAPNFGGNNVFADRFGGNCANSPWSIGPGDWLEGKTGDADGPTRAGYGELCGVSITGNGTFGCPISEEAASIKVAMWATENDGVCTPRCFQVKIVGVFVVTGFTKSPSGDDGIIGYFSAIASSGTLSATPTPIQKIALVK